MASDLLILVKNRELKEKTSLPFGAMLLTDRYFRGSSKDGLELAKAEVAAALRECPIYKKAKGVPIIGVGGSIIALSVIDNALTANAYQHTFTKIRLDELMTALLEKTPDERMRDFNLEKGRADTICAGILPTKLLMENLGSPYLKLCDAGLREGLMELLMKFGAENSIKEPRLFLKNIINNI